MTRIIKQKELSKLNELDIESLTTEMIVPLCANLVHTINHLYERLNQNSANSSLSPSSDKFSTSTKKDVNTDTRKDCKQHNRADTRKKRDQGMGRKQILKTNIVTPIKPCNCVKCQTPLDTSNMSCYTGFYQIELKKSTGEGFYHVVQTKYKLYDGFCAKCQITTRATIASIKTNIDGKTISRRGIVGPTLAAEIIALHKENGTSVRKIAKTIKRLFGLKLGNGTIIEAINNSGMLCEPTVETYRLESTQANYAHMDETSWKDAGKKLWLWVIATSQECVYMIGKRTKETVQKFLSDEFTGWLITDGYSAYRHYCKRFRCWAHLERKATACLESYVPEVSTFGFKLLALLNKCKEGIYRARNQELLSSITDNFKQELGEIKNLCESHKDFEQTKVREFSREILNDWDAIFRILDYPQYPLTNNEAERALRHWVILRKVILGTQSEIGRRATCAIASIMGTAQRRSQDFIESIRACIHAAGSIENTISYKQLDMPG